MIRKKIKRRSSKEVFNVTNMVVVVCSILASYGVVALSNPIQGMRYGESKVDAIASSTYRIAAAFEEYNSKRFTP